MVKQCHCEPPPMSSAVCCICERKSAAIHWHHTVPVACGGRDSLQIPLCGGCHTSLHAAASHVVAQLRRSPQQRVVSKQFWYSVEEKQRAKPYLDTLVTALINHAPQPLHTVVVKIPTTLHQKLVQLQNDLGHRNITQTVAWCVAKQCCDK